MNNYLEPKQKFFSKLYELSHSSNQESEYTHYKVDKSTHPLRFAEIKLGELKSY